MDNALQALVRRRLEELGRAPVTAAQAADLGRDFLLDILVGRKKSVRGPNIFKLARALDVSPDLVITTLDGESIPVEIKQSARPDRTKPSRHRAGEVVPILGTALGSIVSDVRGFYLEDPIGYVPAPPALVGVRDIYALYVEGESMAPMHSPGDLRFVHPHKPAAVGDTVVIQTRHWDNDPGQAYIKILDRRSNEKYHLRQLNPPATISIPGEYVEKIHRVLTTQELFGA